MTELLDAQVVLAPRADDAPDRRPALERLRAGRLLLQAPYPPRPRPARPSTRGRRAARPAQRPCEPTRPALRDDIDSEFLHDYRVAVRRTPLGAGRWPSGVVARRAARRTCGAEFKWLGDITSPTRDLDVFLLDLPPTSRRRCPMRSPSRPRSRCTAFLVEHQREAQRELVADLDYRPLRGAARSAWSRLLDWPRPTPTRPSPEAASPAAEFAGRAHRRRPTAAW